MKDAEQAYIAGLTALSWTLENPERAKRLLALTGLSPPDLRTLAEDRSVLAAVLAFLEAHEPDLIACAAALNTSPEDLVSARRILEI